MDLFDPETYSWSKQKSKDYYCNRLNDFVNLNKIQTSKSEIAKRSKLKKLFDHLDQH